MKVLSVVGARPQFIKLAPVDRALREAGHEHVIVHTGQHYAHELSDALFADLRIPAPDRNLAIGSATHAQQTAAMMVGLEEAFEEEAPDWVLVYGDTNSTVAAALTAVKMFLPIAHLEAGLRSGNRRMPEEHNRIVTDHVADLLLAPTGTAMRHLAEEGLSERSVDVGDVMTDVCFTVRDRVLAAAPMMPEEWSAERGSVLATIHRAENTDDRHRLGKILDRLDALGSHVTLVAHPRLIARAEEFGLPLERANLTPITSLAYSQMVYAILRARCVVTDSGGLQKEAFLLKTPCITVRTETEWPETLVDRWNVVDPELVTDLDVHVLQARSDNEAAPFGRGDAAVRTVAAMVARTSDHG